MCTVAFLWKSLPHASLVVGMNRDEFRARPSEDVHRWGPPGEVPLVAGKDLVSGGAWFAFGPHTFAALTNDRGGESAAPGARSRGEIVVRAARASSAHAAAEELAGLPASEFGRFHLIVADQDRMVWLTNTDADHAQIVAVDVLPGAHVLGNFGLDNHADPVVEALLPQVEHLAKRSPTPNDAIATFQTAMSTEGPPGPCVDFGPYGTRSSAVAAVFSAATLSRAFTAQLHVCDGPPTAESYIDKSALLASFATDANA